MTPLRRRNPSAQIERADPTDGRIARTEEFILRQEAHFSGPLPPPGLLAKYSEVIPNGAERIMAMAERQSAHRERLESRVVDGNVASQTRGSYFAFIIVMTALCGGFWLLHDGKSVAGIATILTSLCGVIGVFFYSKREQGKERLAKSSAIAKPKKK